MFVFTFFLSVFSEALTGCVGCIILTAAMLMAAALPVLVVAQVLQWRAQDKVAAQRKASSDAHRERMAAAWAADRVETAPEAPYTGFRPLYTGSEAAERYHNSAITR